MQKLKFNAGLNHLDEAADRNLDQDHGMHQAFLKLEGIARRMREAFDSEDRDRLDSEITYLAKVVEDGKVLEQKDLLSHTGDRQIWWEIRPFIAFKGSKEAE